MTILGIDPGSIFCGYGVINSHNNKVQLIEYGVIKSKVQENDFYKRLGLIYNDINRVIERTKPEIACFETTFYSKNIQSLTKLVHARSAAILACVNNNIEIIEFSPKEIKKSVTGNGSASKEQVQFMVKKMLNLQETPELFDATDGLAIALTVSFKKGNKSSAKNNWKDFIKANPDKVI